MIFHSTNHSTFHWLKHQILFHIFDHCLISHKWVKLSGYGWCRLIRNTGHSVNSLVNMSHWIFEWKIPSNPWALLLLFIITDYPSCKLILLFSHIFCMKTHRGKQHQQFSSTTGRKCSNQQSIRNMYFPIKGRNEHQNTVLFSTMNISFCIFHRVWDVFRLACRPFHPY